MGYVLLWIENLAVGLLLVATLVACFSRLRRPGSRVLLSLLIALPPLVVYTITILAVGYLRARSIPMGCFYPLVLLTACYVIGVAGILFFGLRRHGDDPAVPVAATWPRGKLALVMLLAIGLHMITWWNLDLAAKQQLASLQVEAGAVGLSVAPARLPDHDNAALVYEQTYEMLDRDAWSEIHRGKWNQWTDFDSPEFDPDDPELKSLLDQQAPTLALLRQAGEKPGCHFGRNYSHLSFDLLLPELSELRDAARLLALDARYRAAQGDMQTALEDVAAMFAMVQHVGSDPLLISALVAVAIDAIATETLEEVLAADGGKLAGDASASAEELRAVDLDGSLSFRRLFSRALRSELAFALNAFYQICTSSPGDLAGVSQMFGMDAPPRPLASPILSYYRMFMAKADVASYRKAMNKFSQLAGKPYHETKAELANYEKQFADEPKGILTSLVMPALSAAVKAATRGDARHRTARLGLAAARYQAERDALPETMDELVPDYLPILPRDPFDGKPMKYRLTDNAAVIYSIGPDGQDDHGAPWNNDDQSGDVTFELRR